MNDPAVYKLIAEGDTVGVFQFESEGMRRALSQVRPDCFADIVALGALYRPGPMDNIPSFALRKAGREKVELLTPLMEPILRETYGIIVYQEQVMSLARELAGYSLGQADLLRRAHGQEDPRRAWWRKRPISAPAPRQRHRGSHGPTPFSNDPEIRQLWLQQEPRRGYAVVSYHTAWLKTHHRAIFYAASMAYDVDNTDRLAVFVDDRAPAPISRCCRRASTCRLPISPWRMTRVSAWRCATRSPA